jgi:hypothetical protein
MNPTARAGNGRLNNGQHSQAPRAAIQRKNNVCFHSAELSPEASAELRDRLVGEIADLTCGDDAGRGHHREVHRCRDEVTWWKNIGVDPTMPARELWIQTRPLAAGVARAGTDVDVTWSNPDDCVTPHK